MSQQQEEKPPAPRGSGTQVVVSNWEGDRAYLASDRYFDQETQRWGYLVSRVPKEGTRSVSHFVVEAHVSAVCHYGESCNASASVQCPRCTQWYCASHAGELFLDRAKIMGEIVMLPAPLCPECHYSLFWRPALERDRAE
ncbi:hypothetical protein [Reticulibacter mediterranei]|uniref:hypothetical protein n=1 Tax=Reticulibacter mediterranei TaxID=2778369 RepID=UPI001C68DDBB|nr:hypothetical protein [Reticulibacter mediterranei]